MCKKRIKNEIFKNKCVQSMLRISGLLIILIMIATAVYAQQNEKLNSYEYLYEDIYQRDVLSIMDYLDSPRQDIKNQAWRALATTQDGNEATLIKLAQTENSKEAWAAVSMKKLSEDQLSLLEELWREEMEMREGISMIFGEQGNEENLKMMLEYVEHLPMNSVSFETRFAIGLLSNKLTIEEETQLRIINLALNQLNADDANAFLYGLYRSRTQLAENNLEILRSSWDNLNMENQFLLDQYLVRLIYPQSPQSVQFFFDARMIENENIQLVVETLQQIRRGEKSEFAKDFLMRALSHPNEQVQLNTLDAIIGFEWMKDFEAAIAEEWILNEDIAPQIRLKAINNLSSNIEYQDLVIRLSEGEWSYLMPNRYEFYAKNFSVDEYLRMLKTDATSINRNKLDFSSQAISDWWISLDDSSKAEQLPYFKEIINFEKGFINSTSIRNYIPLFQDSLIAGNDEFGIIEKAVKSLNLSRDLSTIQGYLLIMKQRFEEESLVIVDSLASQGNISLNQFLKSQDWDLDLSDIPKRDFTKINWSRIEALGESPIWVIETNKGKVEISLNTFSAPATISLYDSLITSSAYDGVPFHRVVTNFVIQGGNLALKDNPLSSDFVVPTEASASHFRRGVVGIASSGLDTEGSQFFVMHQWGPHLNKRYTIIGEVIEGMEVVDRILEGDRVIKSYWK